MCYCGRICPGNCISTSTMSKPMPIVEGLRQQLLSNEDWFAMCRSIQSDASLLLVTTTGFIIDASAMASLTPGVNNLMLPGLSIESVIHPSDWDLLMSEFSLITMFDKPMFNLTLRFAGAFGCYHWLDVSGLVMKTKEMILVAMSTRPYINPSLDSMSPAPPPAEEDSMLNCLDERLAHGFRAVLTSDLDFIKVSPACYFVIGFSPYELLGSNLRQFVCDASVFDFGNNSHFSFLIRTRTGASIPCIMTTQMATTGNNTIMINANINLILDPQQPALLGMTADQLPLAASSKPRQVIRKSSLDPQEQDDYMGMDTRSSLPHDYLSSSAEETVPFDAFGARNHLAASRAALLVAAPILPSSPRANIPQNSFFEGNGGAYVKSEGIELPSSPRSRGSSRSSSPRPSSPAFIHKPQKRAYKNEPKVIADRECESCHTTVSPEWRRGPLGPKSLCNACGLQFAKMHRISPVQAIFSMKQSSPPTSPRRSSSASDLEQNQMQQTRPYKMPSSSAAMRRPKSAPSLTLTEDMFSPNYPFTQDNSSSEMDSEQNE